MDDATDYRTKAFRYFLHAAQYGTLGRAAAELKVSQPAISLALKSLEGSLGFPLFARTAKGMELTAEGAAILPDARQLVACAERLAATARKVRRGLAGHLRIGVPEYTFHVREREILLGEFARAFPEVEIEISGGQSLVQLTKLQSGELDLCIAARPLALDATLFESMAFCSLPVEVLAPLGHPLVAAQPLSEDALEGVSVFVFRRTAHPALYDEAFIGSALGRAKLVNSPAAHLPSILRAASATGALAAGPFSALPPGEIAAAGMVRCELAFDVGAMELLLVRPRTMARPAADACWRIARRLLQ